MALSREDKRFLIGLTVASAVLVVYFGPVRLALRAGIAAHKMRMVPLRQELYLREGSEPVEDVKRALAAHHEALAERLAELRRAVEFDPAAVLDPLDRADYVELSRALHSKLHSLRDSQATPTRVPRIFDPQGEIRQPADADDVPRLRRLLLLSYCILRSAVETRVDILDLRHGSAQPRPSRPRYLDRTHFTLRTQSTLDELAAFIHALSAPPRPGRPSSFLSIEALELARSTENPDLLEARITLAAIRVNPRVTLVTQTDEAR